MKNISVVIFLAGCLAIGAMEAFAQSVPASSSTYHTSLVISQTNNTNRPWIAIGSVSSFEKIFSNLDPIVQHISFNIASVSIQSADLPLAMFKSVKVYISHDNSSHEVLIASNNNISKKTGSSLNLDLNKTAIVDRSTRIDKIDQNSSIEQAIVGRVSGVQMLPSGDLRVRGINNLVDGSPLFIIDGTERNTLKGVNPNDIASVEVLKNFSETALYGVRGANGVFIIKTKTGNHGSEKTTGSLDNFARGSTLRVRMEYVLRTPLASETGVNVKVDFRTSSN